MRGKLSFVLLLVFAFTIAAAAQTTTKPTVEYSTFLNGTGPTYIMASTIDGSGNQYITGYTSVPDYPVTPGAYRRTGNSNGLTMFVTKLNPSGSALIYSTYIGDGYPYGITVDASGDAYIVGRGGPNGMPVTGHAWKPICNGCGFVLKLAGNGASLVYSTGIDTNGCGGGPGGIALDSEIHAVVLATAGPGCYTTPGSYKPVFTPTNDGAQNAYVMKIRSDGSGVLWATYVGGNIDADDWGRGIAMDSSNHPVIVGTTRSPDFPTTTTAYNRKQHGGDVTGDGFVAKLNWDGSQLLASTLIGGSLNEDATSVAVASPENEIYITGTTESKDFPVSLNAVDHTPDPGNCDTTPTGGCLDGFAAKFTSDLSKVVYSTFLGGPDGDEGNMRIAVDRVGHAFIAGTSGSNQVPLVKPTATSQLMFLSVLNSTGTAYQFSTRYGPFICCGSSDIFPSHLSVDEAGNAYTAGFANYVNTTPNAYQKDPGENHTAILGFAARWNIPPCTLSSTNRSVTICTPVNDSTGSKKLLVSAGATDSKSVSQMEVYVDGVAQFAINASYFNDYVNVTAGKHQIKVTATDSSGTFSKTVQVTVQ